jgi:hypothetical protein
MAYVTVYSEFMKKDEGLQCPYYFEAFTLSLESEIMTGTA